jgi:arylsulfatase A-like enzyme
VPPCQPLTFTMKKCSVPEELTKHLDSTGDIKCALRATLGSAAIATAVFEAIHVSAHVDNEPALGALVSGVLVSFCFTLALTAAFGGLLFALLLRIVPGETLLSALCAPLLIGRRFWAGKEARQLALAGRVFDFAVSLASCAAFLALMTHAVLAQYHEPVRISLLVAGLGVLIAGPVLLGEPFVLRRLRALIAVSEPVARNLVRIGLLAAAGILVTATILSLHFRDDLFGAVDIVPVAMAGLFVVLVFVSAPFSNLRVIRVLSRLPLWLVAFACLVAGVGLSAVSEGARGGVDQTGALSGVVYRAVYRVLDMDDDGFAWLIGSDCHPWNPEAGPFAEEVADNGFDEDCDGLDTVEESERYTDPLTRLPEAPDTLRRKRGNVLLIISDATAAKHLKLYGNHRNTMPSIERFAASSAVFENAFTPGNHTSIAMPALLTSRYPSTFPRIKSRGWNSFAPPEWTNPIQVRLQEAGYRTFVTAGHKLMGFLRTFRQVKRGVRRRLTAEEVARHGLRQLKSIGPDPADPVFYVLHFIDPHHPYEAADKPDRFGRKAVDRYDAELAYVDQNLGPILSLMNLEAYRDWLVVITSDHGEAHHEHGKPHHGYTLYNEEVKIPLVIRVPGAGKKRIPTAVSLLDIAPTLLDWCGLEAIPEYEGKSLLPLFGPGAQVSAPRGRLVFSEFFRTGEVYGAFSDRHALIYKKNQDRFELFDTTKDPEEKQSIYRKGRNPLIERQLKKHIRQSLNRLARGD